VGIGRIVSGGQTGVDRAALDVAVAHAIPYGGWCPAGGWAEDLPEPPGLLAHYPALRETPSSDPAERTRWNVRDSDATLVVTKASISSSGTTLTLLAAQELGRPTAVIELLGGAEEAAGADEACGRAFAAAKELIEALPQEGTLNVAGPRESEAPGIYERSRRLLEGVLPSRPG
jgi:hypothetical protein